VELERSGNPSESRREDELDAELAAALSLAAFSLPRFPYLFFRYLAHELKAAPSFSPVPASTVKTFCRKKNNKKGRYPFSLYVNNNITV